MKQKRKERRQTASSLRKASGKNVQGRSSAVTAAGRAAAALVNPAPAFAAAPDIHAFAPPSAIRSLPDQRTKILGRPADPGPASGPRHKKPKPKRLRLAQSAAVTSDSAPRRKKRLQASQSEIMVTSGAPQQGSRASEGAAGAEKSSWWSKHLRFNPSSPSKASSPKGAGNASSQDKQRMGMPCPKPFRQDMLIRRITSTLHRFNQVPPLSPELSPVSSQSGAQVAAIPSSAVVHPPHNEGLRVQSILRMPKKLSAN